MSSPSRRQLGAFLRERRRARTPVLRREDIAAQVAISTEYYTRIEQGRFLPSADVLRRIGEVLALSVDERQYVLDLAHADGALPRHPDVSSGSGHRDARRLGGLEADDDAREGARGGAREENEVRRQGLASADLAPGVRRLLDDDGRSGARGRRRHPDSRVERGGMRDVHRLRCCGTRTTDLR